MIAEFFKYILIIFSILIIHLINDLIQFLSILEKKTNVLIQLLIDFIFRYPYVGYTHRQNGKLVYSGGCRPLVLPLRPGALGPVLSIIQLPF